MNLKYKLIFDYKIDELFKNYSIKLLNLILVTILPLFIFVIIDKYLPSFFSIIFSFSIPLLIFYYIKFRSIDWFQGMNQTENENDDFYQSGFYRQTTWGLMMDRATTPLSTHFALNLVKHSQPKKTTGFKYYLKNRIKNTINLIKKFIGRINEKLQIHYYWKILLHKIILKNTILRGIYFSINTCLYYVVCNSLWLFDIYKIVKNPKRLLNIYGFDEDENADEELSLTPGDDSISPPSS